MYRIELSPGEETAFRSIEELAVAIRRRIVTSRARIWHNASGKWLPIEFHPHYKIAAAMELTPADLVAGPPVKPLELLTLGALMDPPEPVVRQAPVVREAPAVQQQQQQPPVKQMPTPQPTIRKKGKKTQRHKRSSGRPMRIALAGTLLIGCAHLVFTAASAALAKEEVASVPRTHRHLVRTVTTGTVQSGPETTAAAVLPELPSLAPTLRSSSAPASPQIGAFPADSVSAIQPAPDSAEIAAPVPPSGSSLTKKVVDSTGKKAMNRLLHSISTIPASEPSRPKR
jgi:hypothetical protein